MGLVLLALLLASPSSPCPAATSPPHRVYVTLGFHANFYHSWRGDTPDDAGFGTDVRVVRRILEMLDDANARGLDARGYWEFDNHFTLETILPAHAPDIIEGVRRRHAAGLDEILVAPYDNGILSAMTEDEARAVLRWAVSNPWGSGVQDLFGTYAPIVRPQEYMISTGIIPILESEGMRGLVLAYSNYPFTGFSNFIPALPPAKRYNPLWLRLRPDGPRTVVLPAASLGDVINFVSLEKWLLELRRMQTSGAVASDLLVHLNIDADAETWLPVDMPPGLGWIPNTGGLREYIEAVNKYEWAVFTTPGEYLRDHPPVGEVVVRQDLADGAWDGSYSWAEKASSHDIWTMIEQSRLATRRTEALLAGRAPALALDARKLLSEGRDSSFFQRIRALSTTHFGMSTPMVNEERQAVAENIAAAARSRAMQALRLTANEIVRSSGPATRPGAAYRFLVRDLRDPHTQEGPARMLVRVPIVHAGPPSDWTVTDGAGRPVAFSVVNREALPGTASAELMLPVTLRPGEQRVYDLAGARAPARALAGAAGDSRRLRNGHIEIVLDESHGVASLHFDGTEIGGTDFLAPFVTYENDGIRRTHAAGAYEITALETERHEGIQRARLRGRIPFGTAEGEVAAGLTIDLTLPTTAPWLVADVRVSYPRTAKRDLLHTILQKLRRYLDLGWIEVAPFQLAPRLAGSRARPLRVWKHNYLGVTSPYDLDYAAINPKNANLDSFNHQVTAGWVAVSDGRRGLLIAENADLLSSFAFVPMRLRESAGVQRVLLNPFGSYYGKQMDYSHLGGNGLGTEIALRKGAQFRPNGPSYNGRTERFSLLIAPYAGDAPPEQLQRDAAAFFYPPAVVYLQTPPEVDALLPEDMRQLIADLRRSAEQRKAGPLPLPTAFLANPTDQAVDLVWDEPTDPRIDGYEIAWKEVGEPDWQSARIEAARRHRASALRNGTRYAFRVRARAGAQQSAWTETEQCVVGPVPPPQMSGELFDLGPLVLLKILYYSLVHAFGT